MLNMVLPVPLNRSNSEEPAISRGVAGAPVPIPMLLFCAVTRESPTVPLLSTHLTRLPAVPLPVIGGEDGLAEDVGLRTFFDFSSSLADPAAMFSGWARTNAEGGLPPIVSASAAFNA